ncbi:DUF882 domain-containing protein [Mangrovicella endophytica]|uniref:DUF882 domain-containing protein n=1 Tax=Mangrovicella endophytica TaxID=2066697 RepID=UPI000C9E2058|nr:DUF882 domain-containing protein [Mangrovicella endophytica]
MTDRAGRWAGRVASIAAAGLLLFSAGTVAARAETRTLKFYHLHTHEKAEIAYKKDGRYLKDGLKQINWILRDWRQKKPVNMDPRLLDLIYEAYRQSGSRAYINVICGYRAPATNSMLRSRSSGVAKESQHMLGKALDFYLPDVPLKKMREIGLKMQVGGVGYYPKSGSPFVHFDVGNARHWPRMSRRELLAVFPKGNTIHVPSDGKPLPGYQEALASYKKRRGADTLMVANASAASKSSGGGRTLFAALFGGGGADEEEDEVEAAAPTPKAATPKAVPAPVAPKAVTPRAVAMPEVDVAEVAPARRPAVLPSGVALPARDTFDLGAPTPPAGIPEEKATEVASLDTRHVPTPTWAPARAAAAPAAAAVPADEVTTLVAALEKQAADETESAAQLAYNVPTPRQRPLFETILAEKAPEPKAAAEEAIVTASVMPAPRPERLVVEPGKTAAASLMLNAAAPSMKPAAAPKSAAVPAATRVASLAPAAPVAAPRAASVSGKGGRLVRSQRQVAAPAPTMAQQAITSRVQIASLVIDPDLRAKVAGMQRPKADRLVQEAPTSVYTMGFAAEPRNPAADRFVGTAVEFLPVANFR